VIRTIKKKFESMQRKPERRGKKKENKKKENTKKESVLE
jgi:hypothetical protein